MLRFKLITYSGLEEFSSLERASAAGDLVLEKSQIPKLDELRKRWLNRIDQDLVLPAENASAGREKFGNLVDERVRIVHAIRLAHFSDFRSELSDCLTQEQSSRLDQLQLQKGTCLFSVEIFDDPSVKSDLELTPKQTEQLASLKREIENEKDRFLATKMKLEAYKTFFGSLSPNQKDIWRKKLGPPAWFFNINWLAEYMEEDLKSAK